MVLLGGAVRPTALSEGIGRSLLDLPLDEEKRLLDVWVEQSRELALAQGIGRLPLRVMLDATSVAPGPDRSRQGAEGAVTVQVERDPFEYRGTGGVLHDVAKPLADDDYLVVATGAQLLIEPLRDLVGCLAERESGMGAGITDVGILGQKDGTPSGLMLIRCGVLRGISELGFVDLKEQALPAIAKSHRVVVEQRENVSHAVRTTSDYLMALRQYHRRKRGERAAQGAFAEDWRSEFSVVEAGAVVGPGARLFDSVVLAGASVGEGAVLVRSIVCKDSIVRAGERVVDELVCASGRGMKGGRP